MRAHACLIISLLLVGADASAQVYRSVDEQGNVTYSNEPPADAREVEPVEIKPGPSKAQQREAERRTRELENAAGGAGRDSAPGQTKKQRVQEAKAQLQAAERKLEEAKQVGPGDRQGTAGGGSRFTDSYRKRVSEAEANVETARQRLKEAQRAKP